MTQHTPGPWFAKFEAGRYVISYQGEFGPHRALAITGGFQPDNEANARLIAAAPDLLAAARLVIAWFEAEDDHSKADFYKRMEMCRESEAALRAAIAKVEASK